MSDARQAIEAARPVVADNPGSEEQVREAQELLDAAERHLRARRYDRARELANRAKALAIDAREQAQRSERGPPGPTPKPQ